MKEIVLTILVFVIVVVVLFGFIILGDKISCDAKTAQIGFPHRFAITTGCMIEPKHGQWIPLENYRFFEQ